jgi:predicted nucleic acid-binding protein
VEHLLGDCREGKLQLLHLTPHHFEQAWQMRLKYHDKPDNSFVDFTAMVVMQELGVKKVFTGDNHFTQVKSRL